MKKIKKINKDKILRGIWIVLFTIMIVLIFNVSPRITEAIQNAAKYIAEVESNFITRIVELILSVSLVGAVALSKKESEK